MSERWPRLLAAGVRWREGMRALLAPVGSGGRRWDIEAGTARAVRVLQAGALGAPEAVMVVTADGATWPNGSRVIDCDEIDLVLDLTDPATLGCLLAEVRRLSGDPLAHVMPAGGAWKVYYRRPTHPMTQVYGGTEGTTILGALADLLEVTP